MHVTTIKVQIRRTRVSMLLVIAILVRKEQDGTSYVVCNDDGKRIAHSTKSKAAWIPVRISIKVQLKTVGRVWMLLVIAIHVLGTRWDRYVVSGDADGEGTCD